MEVLKAVSKHSVKNETNKLLRIFTHIPGGVRKPFVNGVIFLRKGHKNKKSDITDTFSCSWKNV